MVLHAKNMNASGSWNLASIENKIREKMHERVGGAGAFKVCALPPRSAKGILITGDHS